MGYGSHCCAENLPSSPGGLLQRCRLVILDHLTLQVRVQGSQHVDDERAVEVLADKQRARPDDGVEPLPVALICQAFVSTTPLSLPLPFWHNVSRLHPGDSVAPLLYGTRDPSQELLGPPVDCWRCRSSSISFLCVSASRWVANYSSRLFCICIVCMCICIYACINSVFACSISTVGAAKMACNWAGVRPPDGGCRGSVIGSDF